MDKLKRRLYTKELNILLYRLYLIAWGVYMLVVSLPIAHPLNSEMVFLRTFQDI